MTFDDQGRRGPRSVIGGVAAVVLVGVIAAGTVLYTSGDGGGQRTAPPSAAAVPSASTAAEPVPSVTASLPADAPAALPSLLARPVVRPEQAFPEKSVRLKDGSRYQRVDLATTTSCARGMSQELAALVDQGEGCVRLTSALFTDPEQRSRITVTVASFRRVEDASTVFMMASMDPVTYQVVSLDPPPGAGLPAAPPGSAGLFERLMTVRSVVFANGQWGDGAETEQAALAQQTQGLLQYANDNVVAYEQGGHG